MTEQREMTMEQIEKELGYNVKIVSKTKRNVIHRICADLGDIRQTGRTTMLKSLFFTFLSNVLTNTITGKQLSIQYVCRNLSTCEHIFGSPYRKNQFDYSCDNRSYTKVATEPKFYSGRDSYDTKYIIFLDCSQYTPEQVFQMFPCNDVDIYIAR